MSQALVFEDFEIRPSERAVLVRGQPVVLGARAFDVLHALAERRDRIVSKAELMELVWPNTVVEENNLTVQIWALRRILGATAIVTVTGRGYRLNARAVQAAAAPVPDEVPRPAEVLATRIERRLVAIVHGDVPDWPRLVARDPAGAAGAWKQVRTQCIEKTLQRYGGRPIELTAERTQLEFTSAVEAVDWAMELQSQLVARRLASPPGDAPALHMRIGIAVDDVIVDDGKLVGHGVNVAADLQQCAERDEVLTTQKVCDFVGHKLDLRFEAGGERLMRRLQRPMQVLRVLSGAEPAAPGSVAVPEGLLARAATLAVLPFAEDGRTEDAYFGDGITEEIIATLSLNRSLFVIAHGSMRRFRGRLDDLGAVADELNVRYLVTGSVRRAGQQLRIHVSLLLAHDQRIVWQDTYTGSTEDLFALQSDIAANVAAAVAPQVQDEEVALVRRRPTASYGAYDCVLRALVGMAQLASAEFDAAGPLLRRAIELDPSYAQAHAHLAWWYSLREFEGRAPRGSDEGRLAYEHAVQAVRLDGRDAWALSVAGFMLALHKENAQAQDMLNEALQINPSCAAAWARSGATLTFVGEWQEALRRVQRAIRLSPFDQHAFWHLTICGGACVIGGQYDEAVAWLGKALRLNPRFNGARRMQIVALVCSGELAEARELAQVLLADTPNFSVAAFGARTPFVEPHLGIILQAMRDAGLPD